MMRCRVNSETVSTATARRAARGTSVRKAMRSLRVIVSLRSSNDRSWMVTTERPRHSGGTTYWKCARCGRRRRSARGNDHAMRTGCDRVDTRTASTPAGTNSGCWVSAANRNPSVAPANSRSSASTYRSSPVRWRPRTRASIAPSFSLTPRVATGARVTAALLPQVDHAAASGAASPGEEGERCRRAGERGVAHHDRPVLTLVEVERQQVDRDSGQPDGDKGRADARCEQHEQTGSDLDASGHVRERVHRHAERVGDAVPDELVPIGELVEELVDAGDDR